MGTIMDAMFTIVVNVKNISSSHWVAIVGYVPAAAKGMLTNGRLA